MIKRLSGAAAAVLLLAGCQSSVTPLSISGRAGPASAGFTSVALPDLKSPAGNDISAATYYCLAKSCGADTAVILGVMTPQTKPDPSLTIEEALKIGLADTAPLEKELRSKAAAGFTDKGVAYKSEVVAVNFSTKRATLDIRMRFTDPARKTVYADIRGKFVANSYRFIMSFSESSAAAARYARTAWIP